MRRPMRQPLLGVPASVEPTTSFDVLDEARLGKVDNCIQLSFVTSLV